eukprot:m.51757 g.51757  ORF g.51757 m.51757 type:complete len:459 (+) comp12647_c0_seq1:220-1596(+)
MFAFPSGFYSDPFGGSRRQPTPYRAYRDPFGDDPYTVDPYSMTARRRPQPQQAQYQARRRPHDIEIEEEDPFSRMLFRGGANPYRQQSLRRQHHMEEDERLQQAKIKAKQQQEQTRERQRRALLLRGLHKAATTIQRAYRAHRQIKLEAAKQEAAFLITRTIRAVPAIRRAKKIVASLQKLRHLQDELSELTAAYQRRPFGYRNTLLFVDTVEKLILRLDEISHHRNDFVRQRRKDIVQEAQRSLKYADCVMRMFRHKAAFLVKTLRAYVSQKHMSQQSAAVQVIQRVMTGLPKVKQAKRVRAALSDVRSTFSELKVLREKYLEALQAASRMLEENAALATTSPTLTELVEDCQALITADLSALNNPQRIQHEQKTQPVEEASTIPSDASDNTLSLHSESESEVEKKGGNSSSPNDESSIPTESSLKREYTDVQPQEHKAKKSRRRQRRNQCRSVVAN